MEILGAMIILVMAVLLVGIAIVARTDSNERREMVRATQRAAVEAVGRSETMNCSGWGLWWANSPTAPSPLALHQLPECAPPDGWVSDSELDDHAELIGVHWTVLEAEWSPVVVGFTDYYQMGERDECDTGATPRPVRRVVAASRYGGLPAGIDTSDGWGESDSDAIAESMLAAPDEWVVSVIYGEGPPLPATASWAVWTHTPSDGGDWDHHWDEANIWNPGISDLAARLAFIEPPNLAYTHPDHSGLTSPYEPLPDAAPTEMVLRVQGRRNPLNPSCWVVAVPTGCLGTQARLVGGQPAWSWRKLAAGEGLELKHPSQYADIAIYRSEVGISCGRINANGTVGVAGSSANFPLPARAAEQNRGDSRTGLALLAEDPPPEHQPLRPAVSYVSR